MAGELTPQNFPELFASLYCDGLLSPGTVTFTGHDRAWKWEKKAPSGSRGSSNKLVAEEIAEFTATFFLATVEQQQAWDKYRAMLVSLAHPTPRAAQVFHPDLQANDITEVSVQLIGGFVRHLGGVTVSVQFTAYKPSVPAPVRATPGTPAQTTPAVYDPNAARRRELDNLLDQAELI